MWQPEHEEAYHKLKTAMINSPVMNYFDISKKTHVVVDASPVGLSAILAQTPQGKDTPPSIIAYASRALTPTDREGGPCDSVGDRTFPPISLWSPLHSAHRSQGTRNYIW